MGSGCRGHDPVKPALVVLQQQGKEPLPYIPSVAMRKDRPAAGHFAAQPKGVILHGSRSGHEGNPTHEEFIGTANFQGTNADGLGWHATIGDDEIAVHLEAHEWGFNAFEASRIYLGVEFAQPTVNDPISDGQVRAFCWWMRKYVLPRWPNIPLHFPTHWDVEQSGEIGRPPTGKSDVFPFLGGRAAELRGRVLARLSDDRWRI